MKLTDENGGEWLKTGWNSPTYRSWLSMRHRCHTPSRDSYKYYGAKGIIVCERWRESYDDFLQDMGPRLPGTTLDRINSEGNYTPKNCRWATLEQQAENKKSTKRLTFNNQTLSIKEWAKRLSISPATIHGRIYAGWTIEKTLSVPLTNPLMMSEHRERDARGCFKRSLL